MLPSPPAARVRRGAEPPGPDAEPRQVLVDLADVHQFPVEHGGQIGAVDDQVAHPEVAVHQAGWRRRGSMCGQPAERPLESGGGVGHIVELLSPLAELVLLDEAGSARLRPVDRGQRLRTLNQQLSAALVVESALNATHDRLTGDLVADQERIAQCGRGIGCHQDVGHRRAGSCGGGLDGGLSSMPAWMSSGAPGAGSARGAAPVTASNAHVVRLAPPVSARRLTTSVSSPSSGRSTAVRSAESSLG